MVETMSFMLCEVSILSCSHYIAKPSFSTLFNQYGLIGFEIEIVVYYHRVRDLKCYSTSNSSMVFLIDLFTIVFQQLYLLWNKIIRMTSLPEGFSGCLSSHLQTLSDSLLLFMNLEFKEN